MLLFGWWLKFLLLSDLLNNGFHVLRERIMSCLSTLITDILLTMLGMDLTNSSLALLGAAL